MNFINDLSSVNTILEMQQHILEYLTYNSIRSLFSMWK